VVWGSVEGGVDYMVQQKGRRHIRLASIVKQAGLLQQSMRKLDAGRVTRCCGARKLPVLRTVSRR
jgi:hypothetical protein